jgi:hypothetical protein
MIAALDCIADAFAFRKRQKPMRATILKRAKNARAGAKKHNMLRGDFQGHKRLLKVAAPSRDIPAVANKP